MQTSITNDSNSNIQIYTRIESIQKYNVKKYTLKMRKISSKQKFLYRASNHAKKEEQCKLRKRNGANSNQLQVRRIENINVHICTKI